MNKSVCKKCKCDLSLNLMRYLSSKFELVIECTDIKDKTTICSFKIQQELTSLIIDEIINNKYKIIDVLDLNNNILSKIEINKQCPYYAEHLITELNQ
jgi:hypothetical protein